MAEEKRKISPEELKQILAEHNKWVVSDGKEGKRADLHEADFSEVDLRGANLYRANLSKADLSEADLTGVHLGEANLSEVNLCWANLSQHNLHRTNFYKANLQGTNFIRANLNQADLSEAYLLSGANLSEADLSGAKLSGAKLIEAKLMEADLSGADLRGADLSRADLSGAKLSGAKLNNAQFNDTTVTGCRFSGSNISEAKFLNVKWGNSKELGHFRHKRRMVYDEVNANKFTYEHVADIYRQLKIYYENKRDFAEAGDFGYGQMEMKRKSMTGLTKFFSYLYKIFSGYGELPGLAAWMLLFFLVLFSFFYMFNGIIPKSDKSELTKIHYELSWNLPDIVECLYDFGGAFTHSFQVATFQKDKAYQANDNWGRIFEGLETILLSVQATLFVLALKRKFRR